ncbi:MAG: T9SS type A sorting domain-containing protein [Bacteroidota bacterium]|nr:T9SS type A sorting domain-containing protein [Bacteroidota bacterium]
MKTEKIIIFLTILVIILFGRNNISAQDIEWAPIGAKWYFNYTNMYGVQEYFIYESTKDTVIKNQNCRKLKITHFNADGNSSHWGDEFINQESEKIFYFYEDTFLLLYDFSLNVGDTLKVNLNSKIFPNFSDTAYTAHIVDSVGSMIINGIELKTQYLSLADDRIYGENDLCFHRVIIEKVGNLELLFGEPVVRVEMPPFYGPLRCYQDESIYFNVNGNEPCDTIITSITLLEENHNTINIFPNPTKDHLNIKFKEPCNSHIVIYDINGNVLLNKKSINTNRISLSINDFKTGFYFMKIMIEEITVFNKIMKI